MPDLKRPKMIVGLRWEETSGVDHPANLEEGWVVMKSADGEAGDDGLSEDELTKLAEEEREALDKDVHVRDALLVIKPEISSASSKVKAAFKTLMTWAETLEKVAPEQEDEDKDEDASTDDAKSKVSIMRQILGMIINRAVHGKKPKFATKDIAAAIQSRAGELVKDLAKIINDKQTSKEDKARQVTEVVEALRVNVEAELNSNKEETD